MAEEKKGTPIGLKERTVILVKPDGVARGLVGEILARFEKIGLKIVAMKLVQPGRELAAEHYGGDDEWIKGMGEKSLKNYKEYGLDPVEMIGTSDPFKIGKKIQGWLIDFLAAGPVVAVLLEGNHAIDNVRKLAGNTLPNFAEAGTIRGDLSADSAALGNFKKRAIHNVMHASGDAKDAAKEEKLWFTEEEKFDYERTDARVMFERYYED